MAKKPKYKTYKELSGAFKSGELSRHYFIMMDKGGDDCSLNYHDPKASDIVNEDYQERCHEVFDGDSQGRTVPALFKALEIPCQWC